MAQRPPGADQDYSDFPELLIEEDTELFRCHVRRDQAPDLGCWFFSSLHPNDDPSRKGRFDLPSPRGTCYLASAVEGALMEIVGPYTAKGIPVPSDLLARRLLTTFRTPLGIRAANVSSREASLRGVTAELTTMSDYPVPQSWASALDQSGFDAIWGSLRFSPDGTRGLALFDEEGAPDGWPSSSRSDSAQDVADDLGIATAQTPNLDEIDVVEPPD